MFAWRVFAGMRRKWLGLCFILNCCSHHCKMRKSEMQQWTRVYTAANSIFYTSNNQPRRHWQESKDSDAGVNATVPRGNMVSNSIRCSLLVPSSPVHINVFNLIHLLCCFPHGVTDYCHCWLFCCFLWRPAACHLHKGRLLCVLSPPVYYCRFLNAFGAASWLSSPVATFCDVSSCCCHFCQRGLIVVPVVAAGWLFPF